MRKWHGFSGEEQRVIADFKGNGPDCAKFVSRRLKLSLETAMEMLSRLEREGWLERVEGTFLYKRGFRRPKHMNHTYYRLTRKAELILRGGPGMNRTDSV
ncbi:MAG TPA: DUF2250 domain-containing protein [Thermodesulfobacteriaceae bacterium]|nr:DUF2250 domain-containing protein [Thermodesulfobacteriaceae bacterium]